MWHFCRASDCRKIEQLQERGLHAVFRNNASYPELLKRAALPSFQIRRLRDIYVLMYQIKNNLCPPYINDIFINHRSKYNLRQSDFSAARHSTWQALPPPLALGKLSPDLRKVNTLKCFKTKIRTLDIVILMDNGANRYRNRHSYNVALKK